VKEAILPTALAKGGKLISGGEEPNGAGRSILSSQRMRDWRGRKEHEGLPTRRNLWPLRAAVHVRDEDEVIAYGHDTIFGLASLTSTPRTISALYRCKRRWKIRHCRVNTV